MQPFGLAIVSFALVAVASASPLQNSNSRTTVVDIPVFADYKPGDKCPAPVFSDGCNTCFCSKDSIYAACTLKLCPKNNVEKRVVRSEVPVFPNYKAGDKCPAKYFNDGCNDCVCGNDGVTVACTLKFCPNFGEQKRAVRREEIPVFPNYKAGDKCPAPVFTDGCNSCICLADGVTTACTLRLCPEKRQTRANAQNLPVVYGYQQGDKCPAQQFFDDCNRCACSNDGHSAACTRMACSPRRETRSAPEVPVVYGYQQGDKCPAQQFYDDCNRCFCAADGHTAACTKMACLSHQATVPHIDNFNEIRKCTPHQRFQNKCNGCICGADGASAVCTLMLCAE